MAVFQQTWQCGPCTTDSKQQNYKVPIQKKESKKQSDGGSQEAKKGEEKGGERRDSHFYNK